MIKNDGKMDNDLVIKKTSKVRFDED